MKQQPFSHHHPVRRRLPVDPTEVHLLRHVDKFKPINSKSIDHLISSCPSKPSNFFVYTSSEVVAKLFFTSRSDAVDSFIYFWQRRLAGAHLLVPEILPSPEQRGRLRELFIDYIAKLIDGGSEVNNCKKRVEIVATEVKRITAFLKNPQQFKRFYELREKKERLQVELEQLEKRVAEFKAAMECVLWYLGKKERVVDKGEVDAFNLTGWYDYVKIHSIITRECRRLSEGLPIYAFRRKILSSISSNQVMVLIGETGSGKSTQLVQFLADSGLAASGSIVCTQPRKIASISIAQRVEEEGVGCYEDNFIVSYPTYSVAQGFNSGIIFMTDHCLLRHYMSDMNFEGISYIIVDEAHERSLNTDLLLALVKKELLRRLDMRLIIMSATADASKLADYFYGCCTVHVMGRNFPVDIKYVPDVSSSVACTRIPKTISGNCASYVSDVVKMVSLIHKTEEDGAVLAFLTSQVEVEWACENYSDPSTIVLPMHGKLSHEDQCRVMQNYPGKRKVIFSTNVAETSLTIQGVKYVVDSGMAKNSRFDSTTGMNVLKVERISQSSANQRAGRAGRTGPGKCYRLYSQCDFNSMEMHQEPEIRKVHLGVAVLRILALGIKEVQDFDFIDAPDQKAIEKAIKNLIQLGAVVCKDNVLLITNVGERLVKMSIEPRLGKIILDCFGCGLKKEGLVLAAVMANASSIFCRVGSEEEKYKADCLKVQFCHHDGDLFTLLSVYKEWEEADGNRNMWCWQNSINAKSLRRCQDTVKELEYCLQNELSTVIPSYWYWNPHKPTEYDRLLKKIMLSSLTENVAMYSGSDHIGYEVALTGQHLQLHPACSLLVYGKKPSWVVFGEILSISNQYLICVNSVDYDDIINIQPPLFDVAQLESHKMQMNVISALGNHLLRRFCGKSNYNLQNIISRIQKDCMDDRIRISIDFNRREIQIDAAVKDIERVSCMVKDALESEKRFLMHECVERFLFPGGQGTTPSLALLGPGAEIKHLELEKRNLTVEIFHPKAHELDDKELLLMIEKSVSGIANFFKGGVGIGQEGTDSSRWGKVTFLNPEFAEKAVSTLNEVEFHGSLLKVLPVRAADHKTFPFSAVRAKVFWPCRKSKGVALVHCAGEDVETVVRDSFALVIGGKYVNCEVSSRDSNCVFVSGIPIDVSESEIYDEFVRRTEKRILGVRLLKSGAITSAASATCVEALKREISPFMPNKQYPGQNFHVEVFNTDPKDYVVKAMITFNGSLHLEAAKALDHLQGKVLPGCLSWQKIQCQHVFTSSVSYPPRIYAVISKHVDSLLKNFMNQKGVNCILEKTAAGAFRVRISANATKIVADVRRPLEQLARGTTLTHPDITTSVLEFLPTGDGIQLLRSLEQETRTYILYDRQNRTVRLFGPPSSVVVAESKLIKLLLSFHENKPLYIRLRGYNLPPNLMKEVVQRFGADLHGLREKLSTEVDLNLNTRHHVLRVRGPKEQKQQVEEIISEVALSLGVMSAPEAPLSSSSSECHICLCELEEPYKLEACGHDFCRACLVEQCESLIRSREGFPLCCTKADCHRPFLLVDLKSLLTSEKLEELFRASIGAFVASSSGLYRFCPSPDCPAVYRVADKDLPSTAAAPFVCGACSAETCTHCHMEYHAFISCERYREYKEDPDKSLLNWRKGKGHVKDCPSCGHTIEKLEGCNHIECRCGKHICWECLECFRSSEECYSHLRSSNHLQ